MAAPAAPKNARWERLGDQDCVIKWDPVPGATSYGIRWQRGSQTGWHRSDQGWSGIKGTSFTTKRWALNTGQRFVVYATNKDGNSSYSNATPRFYTPPPKPKNLKAVPGPEGVTLTLSRAGSYYTQGTQLEGKGGGLTVEGPIVTLGNGVSGAAPTTFLALGDGGSALQYRSRGFVGAESPAGRRVFGPWTDWTAPLERWAAPGAPEVEPIISVAVGDQAVVSWVPMPFDNSDQTLAQVRYRIVGASSWTTIQVTGNTLTAKVPAPSAGEVEVQVRTAAMSGTYGDWSASVVFMALARPTVTVPSMPTTASILTVTWTFTQAQGLPQSAAIAELVQNGVIVETVRVNGPAKTVKFKTVLVDATPYMLRVRAATGLAWSSPSIQTFTTAFIKPATPVLSAEWDDLAGTHLISIKPGYGGSASTVSLTLQRDVGEGWEDVATGLPAAATVLVDDLGLTGHLSTTYRLLAYTAQNAVTETQVEVIADSMAVWLRSGLGRLPIRCDPTWGFTSEKVNRVLEYFDGDEKPTVFEDDAVSRVLLVGGVFTPKRIGGKLPEYRDLLEKFTLATGNVQVSTPDGVRLFGVLTSTQVSTEIGGTGLVSLRVEEAIQ